MLAESLSPIRILLVDDHALLRSALETALSSEPDMRVVGTCSGTVDALTAITLGGVDIVLLDINLGSEQGAAFLGPARAAGFMGKILVVTAGVSDREAAWLLNRGCSGIFRKTEPLDRLIDQIRYCVRQQSGADSGMKEPVQEPAENTGQGFRKPLTPRESKVLRHVCEGLTNKEIGQLMDVSEHSVKSFVQQLFAKTGARSRAQLVAFAIEEYWDQLD